jgi:formylglycine-generating enzyme required for sulfatase activity
MIPDHFPPSLAQLGFQRQVISGVELIIPPVRTVPAGPFLIGSDPERDPIAAKQTRHSIEQPQHSVILSSYDIARFPLTVAEYACFVRARHAAPPRAASAGKDVDWPMQLQCLDHPVVGVSWLDAQRYVRWLSAVSGQPWRLPTEAEWEKAARSTDGRIYPWGDGFDVTRCNTKESGVGTTTPVGSYPAGASPYGVEDLAGNVWEWTSSRPLPYPYTTPTEGEDGHERNNRVWRGGAWNHDAGVARSAYRLGLQPGVFGVSSGFRLVQAIPRTWTTDRSCCW